MYLTWERKGMRLMRENRYALETMTAFALLFIAFGVGLDPRQKGVFGPALSPILVRQNSGVLVVFLWLLIS